MLSDWSSKLMLEKQCLLLCEQKIEDESEVGVDTHEASDVQLIFKPLHSLFSDLHFSIFSFEEFQEA